MRAWLRRNRLALATILVSLAGASLVLVALPVSQEYEPNVVVASEGEPIEAFGYRFTLVASEEFAGQGSGDDGNSIPTGSALVAALLDVEPVGDSESLICDAQLTSREGPADRVWRMLYSTSTFGYAVGDDTATSCSFDTESETLEVVFVTPEGTRDGASVDLSTIGSSRIVRLELD